MKFLTGADLGPCLGQQLKQNASAYFPFESGPHPQQTGLLLRAILCPHLTQLYDCSRCSGNRLRSSIFP